MKAHESLILFLISLCFTITTLIFYTKFRHDGTTIDYTYYLVMSQFMTFQLSTFLYENYKTLKSFTLFISNFMLCTLFFTGIYSMIYSQVQLHNFEHTLGVPTLILKYISLTIMICRFYSFAICWLVIAMV